LAKHLLPLLPAEGKSAFAALSARVGSIGDNHLGGWHAYRASKAALNMLLRNLAIELGRRKPEALCVGLHPGTVDTPLSAPFQGNVAEGKLFTPAFAAGRLLAVLEALRPEDSGQVFAWDGQRVEP
jgi:NAD(P)-dependent dehydrogenase (short-subunit alcohol dehydrogenase family)